MVSATHAPISTAGHMTLSKASKSVPTCKLVSVHIQCLVRIVEVCLTSYDASCTVKATPVATHP